MLEDSPDSVVAR